MLASEPHPDTSSGSNPSQKEIEVLFNEIFLPILEMRHATLRQKSLLFGVYQRLCRTHRPSLRFTLTTIATGRHWKISTNELSQHRRLGLARLTLHRLQKPRKQLLPKNLKQTKATDGRLSRELLTSAQLCLKSDRCPGQVRKSHTGAEAQASVFGMSGFSTEVFGGVGNDDDDVARGARRARRFK